MFFGVTGATSLHSELLCDNTESQKFGRKKSTYVNITKIRFFAWESPHHCLLLLCAESDSSCVSESYSLFTCQPSVVLRL